MKAYEIMAYKSMKSANTIIKVSENKWMWKENKKIIKATKREIKIWKILI